MFEDVEWPPGGEPDDEPGDELSGLIPAEDVDGWLPGGCAEDDGYDAAGDDGAGGYDAAGDDVAGAAVSWCDWSAVARELAAIAAADELEQAAAGEELAGLDAAGTLDRLSATATRVNAVLVDQLRLVAQWADLHGHIDDCGVPGAERLVSFGGDGTPQVAEFAAAELGVALRASTAYASHLLADTLDLRHRFPLLWRRTLSGEVPVAIARRVVEQARPLSAAAAAVGGPAGRVDGRWADLAAAEPRSTMPSPWWPTRCGCWVTPSPCSSGGRGRSACWPARRGRPARGRRPRRRRADPAMARAQQRDRQAGDRPRHDAGGGLLGGPAADSGGVPAAPAGPPNTSRGPPARRDIKTTSIRSRGWSVTAIKTDTWLWRTPTGHYSLVDPTGTTHLGRLS